MKSTFLFLLIVVSSTLYAQDPHFSQFNNTCIYTNPAFAGTAGGARFVVAARYQWPKISGDYKTGFLSYDQYFRSIRGGIALNSYYDEAGSSTIKTFVNEVAYARHISIKNKVVIRPAVQIGYRQRKIELSQLTFGSQIDPNRGFSYNTPVVPPKNYEVSNIDISTGLLIYTRKMYVGFSIFHITQPNQDFFGGFSHLPRKYQAHAGYYFVIDSAKSFLVMPSVLMAWQQNFEEYVIGLTFKYKYFLLGCGMRVNDASILSFGFEYDFFRINYSYDYTVSTLTNQVTGGSHELSLVFRIKTRKEKNNILSFPAVAF